MIGKKTVFITLFALILVLIISLGALFYLNSRRIVSPVANLQATVSPAQSDFADLVKWEDQAEFSFSYPKNLKINTHEEDKINYAHIELTAGDKSGSLTVWVKDTSVDTLDGWVKANKAEGAIDSMLDGVPAKKILSDTSPKKIITSAINKGYLYQIETELDGEGYWDKINKLISSNFKFIYANEDDANTSVSTQETENDAPVVESYDEEEVLE